MKDKSAAAGNWPGKLEWLFVTLLSAGYLCGIKMKLCKKLYLSFFYRKKSISWYIFLKHPVTTWKMLILTKHVMDLESVYLRGHTENWNN